MAHGISILPLWMSHAGTSQKFIVWRYISYENTHDAGRELCPALLPATLQGFWGVWAAVWLILAQPGSVLLIWHQRRYLVASRMCPGPTHGLGALRSPVVWAFQVLCHVSGHLCVLALLFKDQICFKRKHVLKISLCVFPTEYFFK